MKKIITLIALFIYTSSFSQILNQEVKDDNGSTKLLGVIDKNGLTKTPYNDWFTKNYDNYKVNEALVNSYKDSLNTYTIKAFLGTWCGDSKREVPRFYKILEACNFPEDQLTVVALSSQPDMYKQSPQHEEEGLNIHRVPTFIFYKNRKEVNRIVERPVETLEKDILNIVSTNNYESSYQIVTKVNLILKNDGLNGLKAATTQLAKTYKPKVTSMYELNTYGRILYSKNRVEEAIEVFKLNVELFPEIPNTHMSLANTLGVSGEKNEAITVLEKAIKLFPDNKDLVENLHVIKTN